jgi:hypothetical protein
VKGEELQQIKKFASAVVHARDPATIELPQDGSVAIDGLPRLKGYSCTSCRHVTVSCDNVMAHQRIEQHTPQGLGWIEVILQSFERRKHARYWVVAGHERRSSDDSREGKFDGLTQSLKACEEMLRKEAEKGRKTVEEAELVTSTSRWVKFMGWKKHLRHVDRRMLREAGLDPPTLAAEQKGRNRATVEENKRMRLLADSFDRELRRSARRVDRAPTQSLKWLASVDQTKPVGQAGVQPVATFHISAGNWTVGQAVGAGSLIHTQLGREFVVQPRARFGAFVCAV